MNLDAEFELADPAGYRRSPRMQAHCAELGRRFLRDAQACAEPGLRHRLWSGGTGTDAAGTRHLSWCPTPSAQRALPGLLPDLSPALLARVNHRRFALERCGGAPGSLFCPDLDSFERFWAAADQDRAWRFKRGLGFGGRWQKRQQGPLSSATRTWVAASMQAYGGGLLVEPCRELELECALHGLLRPDGECVYGAPTLCRQDAEGRFASSEPADERLRQAEREALQTAATTLAEALWAEGYRGPFGLDGYRYAGPDGPGFVACSELNARFTMGFLRGFAGRHMLLLAS